MNLNQAAEHLEYYVSKDIPAFLWGAPGVGKSDVVRAVSEPYGKLIEYRATTRGPVDVMGLPAVEGNTTKWKVPDEFPQVERDGECGTIFIDELNAAAPSMQVAMMGFTLDRFVGDYHLPKGWRILAAGNRQSDRAAAQRMPSALANRFAHIDVDADIDCYAKWAYAHDIDPMLVAFLRWKPDALIDTDFSERAFRSPRSWTQVAKVLDAPAHMLHDQIGGLVGSGGAAELTGFLRVAKDLPSLDMVLANPTSTPIPTRPDARFAMAIGLAAKVSTSTQFEAGMIYTERMPAEFSVHYAIDATTRDTALSHTKVYTDWAARNSDITFS